MTSRLDFTDHGEELVAATAVDGHPATVVVEEPGVLVAWTVDGTDYEARAVGFAALRAVATLGPTTSMRELEALGFDVDTYPAELPPGMLPDGRDDIDTPPGVGLRRR